MKKVIKHMKIVLIQDVSGLGKAGQIVNVKPGFARNYLISQSLAVLPGDPKTVPMLQKKKEQKEALNLRKRKEQETLARLSGKKFVFKAKADKKGKLYGSIGPKEIADKIGVEENIIKAHYKEVGEFPLQIKSSGKTVEIQIEIQQA